MGCCLPSSCTTLEIEKSLNKYFENLDYPLKKENVTFSANISSIFCQSSDQQREFDVYDTSFCILAVGLIITVVTSTICDYHYPGITKKDWVRDVIMAFSARANFWGLAKPESSDKALAILYGIRTFAMCMIIMDHRFLIFAMGPMKNFDVIEEGYRNIFLSYIYHGDLFVDTCFLLSGLLVMYNLMGIYKNRLISPVFVIAVRYLRLTPAYAFVIFFCTTILYHTGSGPSWEAIIGTERADCRQTWWTNILYISNYVNAKQMCLVASWYLPCDFHYFVVASALLILYKRSQRLAVLVYIILITLSILVPFFMIFYYERQAFMRFLPDFLNSNIKEHEEFIMTYTKSHFRFSSYFLGIAAGYIFYKMNNKVLHSKCLANAILVVSFVLMGITLFVGGLYYNPYHLYNPLEHAFYGSLHRPIWALGTIGLIFSVGYGEHGFIYECLSWKVWIPISKLAFGAYLTHFPIQMRIMATTQASNTFGLFDVFCLSLSDIFLAFVMGLVLYLIVEAPSRKLFGMLFVSKEYLKKESEKSERSKL